MLAKPVQSNFWRIVWTSMLIVVVTGSLLPGDSPVMEKLDSLAVNDNLRRARVCATLHETATKLGAFLAFVAIMGVLLELGQLFVPGRTCDFYDVLADGAGILVGFLLGLPLRATIKP
jgi:hypothetical protein